MAINTTLNLIVSNTQPPIPVTSVFGWIVVQQRVPAGPAFNWNRTWSDYKNGFGSIESNFWFGLERVHMLTSGDAYRLRIEVQQSGTGLWYSGEYWTVTVGDDPHTKYRLTVSGFEIQYVNDVL